MAVVYSPARDARRLAFSPEFRPAPRLAALDLYRTEDSVVLNLDLPGVDAGSIDVDVDGAVLTVRAQRTAVEVPGATWISRERQSGTVVRKLRLDESIDRAAIAADYANGVLTVSLPLAERAKPRKVTVTGAPAGAEQGEPAASE